MFLKYYYIIGKARIHFWLANKFFSLKEIEELNQRIYDLENKIGDSYTQGWNDCYEDHKGF